MGEWTAHTRGGRPGCCWLAAGALTALTIPAARAEAPALATAAETGDVALGPTPGPSAAPMPAGAVGGMGDINLYPKRLVIDAHNRVGTIGLYNRTVNTGDYEVALSDMMMQPDGRIVYLEAVSDPAERAKVRTASSFLRFSPHRVTLPGSESQMVRIMAHVPPDLPPGEYRAHFSVVAVPPEAGGLTIQQATGQAASTGIGVHIVPRFGISIPVIVRVGETTLSVGITGTHLVDMSGGAGIAFTITRDGTRSAFGDITVTAPGQKEPLALARGVGVYTELARRELHMGFSAKADPRSYAHGAHLTITYIDDDAAPGKLLARQEFVVP